MRTRNNRYFVGDFETTVYDNQQYTEVWASACVELYTEDVHIFHSINEQYEYFLSLDSNLVIYYHNLKFDGSFWLDFLMTKLGYEQACVKGTEMTMDFEWIADKDMKSNTFKYSISSMGQWYYIKIKKGEYLIELRDSLKLLPFSLKRIGKSFGTKHQKLEMDYKGFRYAGCEITESEKAYIANDVLVIKEALEIMYNNNHKKLTIGSCCLDEYKKIVGYKTYTNNFPNLYDMPLDETKHKYKTAGDWVHSSYRGGWCYLVSGKENKIYHNGTTADVNSLYPSVMSSESGSKYPIGEPKFWCGNYIPSEAKQAIKFYFVRFKTRFYLKQGKLPFIQIKSSMLYKGNEMLETSDVYDNRSDSYSSTYIDLDGNNHDTRVELTMTMYEFELFLEHYNVVDFEILDGCYFDAEIGLFDNYINKYKKIKMESKGAKRELAKLFLNNLYGKMASSTTSNFKIAFIKPDKSIGFYTISANDKTPGYIPIGSAITSYARIFTIKAAQANFHGVNKRGFIYADTDSIHCDLMAEELTNIREHDTNFCCWKLESNWDTAIFTRQKTYIEHIVAENKEPIDEPYYNVKCAGMPSKCKDLFIKNIQGYTPKAEDNYSDDELEFLSTPRTINDFKIGLKVPGKLLPKRICGGTVLVETTYEMR